MFRNLEELVEAARAQGPARIAIAAAQDPDVIEAMKKADEIGLAKGMFVGDQRKICALAEAADFKIPDAQLISEPDVATAACKAIALIQDGRANLLMKGKIKSADLMRAVLDKADGLRAGVCSARLSSFRCRDSTA